MISRNSITPAHPPQLQLQLPWAPSPSPSTPPLTSFTTDVLVFPPPPSKHQQQPIDFSPPLIAMVVIAAVAFLIVTYSRLLSRHFLPPLLRQFRRYRRWRRRRQLLLPSSVDGSVVMDSPPYVVDLYGLDDSVIKSMPLSVYSSSDKSNGGPIDEFQFPGDCAVCLLEFVDNDYVRTLPLCVHSFHVDCIDVWLRSHASCPLCRAGVLPRDWPTSLSPVPLVPVMASRIRPSFDEGLLLDSIFLDPPPSRSRRRSDSVATVPEIVPAQSESEAAAEARPGMLKRSYSFGFERNFSSERLVMEPATASPWRHRLHHHHHHRRGSLSFWRRPSPFSALAKHHRVFSFRSNRASIKSPFSGRRRGVGGAGFAPLSESACIRYTYYHSSSRGSKSMAMASPMFGRSSVSSRMRCGDPEALISPERYREP